MSKLWQKDGKILMKDNKLLLADECCCDDSCNYMTKMPRSLTAFYSVVNDRSEHNRQNSSTIDIYGYMGGDSSSSHEHSNDIDMGMTFTWNVSSPITDYELSSVIDTGRIYSIDNYASYGQLALIDSVEFDLGDFPYALSCGTMGAQNKYTSYVQLLVYSATQYRLRIQFGSITHIAYLTYDVENPFELQQEFLVGEVTVTVNFNSGINTDPATLTINNYQQKNYYVYPAYEPDVAEPITCELTPECGLWWVEDMGISVVKSGYIAHEDISKCPRISVGGVEYVVDALSLTVNYRFRDFIITFNEALGRLLINNYNLHLDCSTGQLRSENTQTYSVSYSAENLTSGGYMGSSSLTHTKEEEHVCYAVLYLSFHLMPEGVGVGLYQLFHGDESYEITQHFNYSSDWDNGYYHVTEIYNGVTTSFSESGDSSYEMYPNSIFSYGYPPVLIERDYSTQLNILADCTCQYYGNPAYYRSDWIDQQDVANEWEFYSSGFEPIDCGNGNYAYWGKTLNVCDSSYNSGGSETCPAGKGTPRFNSYISTLIGEATRTEGRNCDGENYSTTVEGLNPAGEKTGDASEAIELDGNNYREFYMAFGV